tara:strand:- start:6579 stop:7160 length:582 start_codon:yes stop_codon:yes gene_type:complete
MTIDNKNDVWNNITADAKSFESLSTEGGKELSDLIRATTDMDKKVSDLEEELKAIRVQRQKYLFDLIPAKMVEMGMDKVVVDGSSVSLSNFVQASMPKDPIDKTNALNHLREIGCEDFIKNKIEVSFGINEDNSAKALQADLDERGLDTSARIWIEPPTLKKLIRERVEANQTINLELFNAYVGQVAKIKGEK